MKLMETNTVKTTCLMLCELCVSHSKFNHSKLKKVGAIATIWIISLVIGLVVIGVVAFLLSRINNTAKEIDIAASKIWTQGKMVANNTIQIPLFLSTTNKVVNQIHDTAVNIVGGAEAIKNHTEGCPGCPDCILEGKN